MVKRNFLIQHLLIICLLLFLPFTIVAQDVTILSPLVRDDNSVADAQYANIFGSYRNDEDDDPFPYVVICMNLVGDADDIAEAKRNFTLALGRFHKVEGYDKNQPNKILFLIKSDVQMIYLQCGDGCPEQELNQGSMIMNKVYNCTVEYHKKKVEQQQVVQPVFDFDSAFAAAAAKLQVQQTKSDTVFVERESESDEPLVLADSIVLSYGGVEFKMRLVKGGKFYMGSTGKRAEKIEKPAHYVTISDYYMAETEVTQALWKAVYGTDPSTFKGDSLPVENVNWDDCVRFIAALNTYVLGYRFNLPTEAQWEYAAKGGFNEDNIYYRYSGGGDLVHLGWYEGNSGKRTHNVKSLRANSLGIYDMNGNVSEWCSDFYDKYQTYDLSDPTGPIKGERHVIRGGNWNSESFDCRNTSRYSSDPSRQGSGIGFRLVMPVPPKNLMHPVLPAEPVEPVESAEPIQPTEPTQPAEPIESVEQ